MDEFDDFLAMNCLNGRPIAKVGDLAAMLQQGKSGLIERGR